MLQVNGVWISWVSNLWLEPVPTGTTASLIHLTHLFNHKNSFLISNILRIIFLCLRLRKGKCMLQFLDFCLFCFDDYLQATHLLDSGKHLLLHLSLLITC